MKNDKKAGSSQNSEKELSQETIRIYGRKKDIPKAGIMTPLIIAMISILIIASGVLMLFYFSGPSTVETVVLEMRRKAMELPNPNPVEGHLEYYIKIYHNAGVLSTPFKQGPLSNRLQWKLPQAIELSTITDIEVWDKDKFMDDKLEHYTLDDLDLGDKLKGKDLVVILNGSKSKSEFVAWALIVFGAIIFLLSKIIFLRKHVI